MWELEVQILAADFHELGHPKRLFNHSVPNFSYLQNEKNDNGLNEVLTP